MSTACFYDYPQFPVVIRLTLDCETPEVTRFLGKGGVIEVKASELTLTTQDGTDHGPGWYYRSFPKSLREEYEKKWHEENDSRVSRVASETTTYRAPDNYDNVKPHLRNFFSAVRSRSLVVEDAAFGNNTAIACHMANASYFKKGIASWDGGGRMIKT